MKKNKIIFVHFNRFLDEFDWKRYELDLLSKKYFIEVHILINLVHPHLKHQNYSKSYKNKNIKIFQNLDEWKKKINNYNRNNHFIFQTFPYNFIALKIFRIIKKKKFKTSIIYINNLPTYDDYKKKINYFENFYKKFLSIFFRPKHSLATLKKIIISFIFKVFSKNLNADFSLVGGKKKINYPSKKIIKINSWDYSNSLRRNFSAVKNNYILYLSDGETRHQSDSQLWNTKRVENTNLYLKNLNKFFDAVEKKYKTKIIIAAHPRSNLKLKKDLQLGNRKIFFDQTCKLTKNAKFIISFGSSALSYAVLYNKPILFIYSSSQQSKNISGNKFSNFFSQIIDCNRVDIDKNISQNKYLIKKINSELYRKFKVNYIINLKYMQNYKIISNYINKLKNISP